MIYLLSRDYGTVEELAKAIQASKRGANFRLGKVHVLEKALTEAIPIDSSDLKTIEKIIEIVKENESKQ